MNFKVKGCRRLTCSAPSHFMIAPCPSLPLIGTAVLLLPSRPRDLQAAVSVLLHHSARDSVVSLSHCLLNRAGRRGEERGWLGGPGNQRGCTLIRALGPPWRTQQFPPLGADHARPQMERSFRGTQWGNISKHRPADASHVKESLQQPSGASVMVVQLSTEPH